MPTKQFNFENFHLIKSFIKFQIQNAEEKSKGILMCFNIVLFLGDALDVSLWESDLNLMEIVMRMELCRLCAALR